jgi:glucose/arabinose dehydrogenase
MRAIVVVAIASLAAALPPPPAGADSSDTSLRVGQDAFGGWRDDAPGVRRLIPPRDLPSPYASPSAANSPDIVARPEGAVPRTLPGFTATRFVGGLDGPRALQVAPNGDIFVAESSGGRIRVLRPKADGSGVATAKTFAGGLDLPYGIAFYPPGPEPRWVYVASVNEVVRFAYRPGDLEAEGAAQPVIGSLPEGGNHWTRDIAFSPDGSRLYLAVGSASNDFEDSRIPPPAQLADLEHRDGKGALWGEEAGRADVLSYAPDGSDRRVYATGIRNCGGGLAVQPSTGTVWCSTNERDGLGDNLVPDYVTRVKEGGFYGWPWYYIGDNQDPRHKDQRPDLEGSVLVPDVLLQAHSAALQMTFYHGDQFPPAMRDDVFVALHGSWNRAGRTGYKIVRVPVEDGRPTGIYEDFVTDFVVGDDAVWGRPVGIATGRDGSLLFSDDANGTIWRVTYTGGVDAAAYAD